LPDGIFAYQILTKIVFWKALEWKLLVYIMNFWYLWPCGLFHSRLVYCVIIWYIFQFWYVGLRKNLATLIILIYVRNTNNWWQKEYLVRNSFKSLEKTSEQLDADSPMMPYRVARWFVFKPNVQIWANIGEFCNGRCWYILRTFGPFYGLLLYFMEIWYSSW
jgi:hypothetical protein